MATMPTGKTSHYVFGRVLGRRGGKATVRVILASPWVVSFDDSELVSSKFADFESGAILRFCINISWKSFTRTIVKSSIISLGHLNFGYETDVEKMLDELRKLGFHYQSSYDWWHRHFGDILDAMKAAYESAGTRYGWQMRDIFDSGLKESDLMDMNRRMRKFLFAGATGHPGDMDAAVVSHGIGSKVRAGYLGSETWNDLLGGIEKAKTATEAEEPAVEAPEVPDIEEPLTTLERLGFVKVSDIFARRDDMRVFKALINLAADGQPVNAIAVGPSGYGKTALPMAIAKERGMECLRVNCSAVRDPVEWFGYREAVDGSTIFVKTEMAEMIERGNAIIVLDEFNRVEPWVANSMLQIMDLNGETLIHGERIRRGKNVIFFATINLGSKFSGTFALDAALMNRIDTIFVVGALPPELEKQLLVDRAGISMSAAKQIVEVIGRLREIVEHNDEDVDVSTRSSLKIARLVAAGLSGEEAFQYAITNAIDPESPVLKEIIDTIRTFKGLKQKEATSSRTSFRWS